MTKKPFAIFSDGRHNRDEGVMSFGDHLDELRARLIYALVIPLPLSIVVFFFSNTLIDWLLLPLFAAQHANDVPAKVQELAPPEVLMTKLKLSIIAAIVISIPWILWQIWLFVRPGLMDQEKRFIRFLLPGSTILTTAGVALLYFVMLPLMLQVLIAFGNSLTPPAAPARSDTRIAAIIESGQLLQLRLAPPAAEDLKEGDFWIDWPDLKLWWVEADADTGALTAKRLPTPSRPTIAQEYRISWYINFVLVLMLGIVIAFQLPLVMVVMGWTGLATPHWLRSQRRYAVMVCAVVAAVITPADAASMLMMLVPLYMLFELGILLMVIAPAHKVARGTVLQAKKSTESVARQSSHEPPTDNLPTQSDHTRQAAQPDPDAEQSNSTEQDQPPQADDSTDGEEER